MFLCFTYEHECDAVGYSKWEDVFMTDMIQSVVCRNIEFNRTEYVPRV